MSGHSKWATIKRSKAANDAKKGAIFTKLGNLITVVAREKGGDPTTNFTLRVAMDKARAANMPKDNIDKAIKRGTGELGGGQIVELYYEGLGPANSQFIVRSLTDNKNRSASNIRHAFTKFGGSFASVMWNFEQKGVIRVDAEQLKDVLKDRDSFELELIDAGSQDIKIEDEGATIISEVADLPKLNDFFEKKHISTESAGMEYVAKDELDIKGEDRDKIERFIEDLDDLEDVSDYFTNANV